MNCTECRENLVAQIEGLLDVERRLECEVHCSTCKACRDERDAIAALHGRLAGNGPPSSEPSLAGAVMNRILKDQTVRYRRKNMIKTITRWGLGVSGVAAAAFVLVTTLLWAPAKSEAAAAAEVLAKGVQAASDVTSIHIKCRLRTRPGDNFAYIDGKADLVPIEMWKEFDGQKRWRIDKPGRSIVMDGKSTIMLMRSSKLAIKLPMATKGAFDTGWLHELADVRKTISDDLNLALSKGQDLKLSHEKRPDGAKKRVVTIEAKSGLPEGDYLKNKFFMDADTKRVYRFDEASGRLEDIKVYLHDKAGDVDIFEVDQIDYNQAFEPSVFVMDLPKDVTWHKDPEKLPDNEKYSKMTPEEAARGLFEACAKEDWNEVEKYGLQTDERFKKSLGGLEIIKIGESFTSAGNDARFVPYEIKLKDGAVRKHNLAFKKPKSADRWIVDGGI